ncbi:MAG: hypothetical protein HOF29_13225 [Candidatus Marinimicrobia bacterium]|jgi:hypothetical protein|nr:hypothetical protein [Candidatus Neomarinimicrobiota bacterium]MBT5530146.1 hypothetical protein [Cytophagia bacterium]
MTKNTKSVFSLEPKDHPLYADTLNKIQKWVDFFELSKKTVEINVQILNINNRPSRANVNSFLNDDTTYQANITLYEPIAEISIMHELAHIHSSFMNRTWLGHGIMDWSKIPEINGHLRHLLFYFFDNLEEFVLEAFTQNLFLEMIENGENIESFTGHSLAEYPTGLLSDLDFVPENHFRSLHLVLWNFLVGSWNELLTLYNYSILSRSTIFKEYFVNQKKKGNHPITFTDTRKKLVDLFANNASIDINSYKEYAKLFCSFVNIMARAQTGSFKHAVSFNGEKIVMETPLYVCLKELNNCYNEIESKYSNHDFDDDFTKYITPKNIQNMDVLSITNLITGQYESEQMRNDILSNILIGQVTDYVNAIGGHGRVKLIS